MKYKKKPVAIDAIQWTGDNIDELRELDGFTEVHARLGDKLIIHTLEGDHRADIGDYIIRGVRGEFYPCKKDIFEETYEPADEELSRRETPMKITEIHVDEYYCPACGAENNCDQGCVQDAYCPACGQRLLQEPPKEEWA